ncbi:MAG: DUF4412 domain-containing protein, partial [Polyangiaceae bacterium]
MTKYVLTITLSAAALVACSKTPEKTTNPAASASVTHAVITPSASAAATPAPGPFEGEIVVSVASATPQKLPGSIDYQIKADKLKYTSTTPTVRAIDDQSTQHAYTVDDTKKKYEDIDTKPAPAAKAQVDAKVQKVGKSEVIAGLGCDDWTIDTGDTKVDVCAAQGVAFFDLDRDAKAGTLEPSWATALTKAKAFPLRAIVHDKTGKEEYRVVATKVDRKKIDDSVFA